MCLWLEIPVSRNFWNSTQSKPVDFSFISLVQALVHEQAVCTEEYKQGQTSNEQSFMKSDFSLFTWTTIQTGCSLKYYFRERPPRQSCLFSLQSSGALKHQRDMTVLFSFLKEIRGKFLNVFLPFTVKWLMILCHKEHQKYVITW